MENFFGIGIFHTKTAENVGGLFRSAQVFGASFVFTVGRRYKKQITDTTVIQNSIPLFHFIDIADLHRHLPLGCRLIGIELNQQAVLLDAYDHPRHACYLLGAEDHGLSNEALEKCHELIQIPYGECCLNVATAGSICMYDRAVKYANRNMRAITL